MKETRGLIKNQVSSELKISKSNMKIWAGKSSTSFYKIKLIQPESNIKLITIEKKFFKLFFKRCIGGRFSYLSNQRAVKLWTLRVNGKPPGIGSV